MCDSKGRIIEVLRDDLNLCLGIEKGTPLTSLVASSSTADAERFLNTLRNKEAVFGWRLNVVFADKATPLHFAGGVTDDYMLVIASLSEPGIARLEAELLSPHASEGGSADLATRVAELGASARGLHDAIDALRRPLSEREREATTDIADRAARLRDGLEDLARAIESV